MTKLINQFADDWKGEVEKQISMSKRAREILLRWGSFSEDYVERAELLCDLPKEKKLSTKRSSLWMIILSVAVISPFIAIIPFVFALEGDGVDPSSDDVGLVSSSVWLGVVQGYVVRHRHQICILSTLNHILILFISTYTLQVNISTVYAYNKSCFRKDSVWSAYVVGLCCWNGHQLFDFVPISSCNLIHFSFRSNVRGFT